MKCERLEFACDGEALRRRKWPMKSITILFAAVIAVPAIASGPKTPLDLSEVQILVRNSSGFPLVANDRVLSELNGYLTSPSNRHDLRSAFRRLDRLRPALVAKLGEYHAPQDLLAVPVVESGYRNLPQSRNPLHAAGLWQFLRATGRHFGLRIDNSIDERLDELKETDAAIRYITAARMRFNDWPLALLSYNAGEETVQRWIDRTSSRDAFRLIEAGFEGDARYLAKIMAVALIIKNPSLLARH